MGLEIVEGPAALIAASCLDSGYAKPKAYQNVSTWQGLAESMTERGYEVINRLRSFRFVPADKQVAERLGVEEGATVTQIKRVRLRYLPAL